MKESKFLYKLFLSFIICSILNHADAQVSSIVHDSIDSKILNERRFFRVYLPKDYTQGKVYDVLYILDAADNEDMAAPVVTMATERQLIPSLITVCISNRWLSDVRISSRERDFEPTKEEGFPIAGAADNFINFLQNELVPHITSTYSGKGKKLIFGHSLSGLFTIYTLLTQPNAFDFYMSSDPSLWWDDSYVNKIAALHLANLPVGNIYLYMAGRSGEMYHTQGLSDMENILKRKAPQNLKWMSVPYENEHHGSVTINSLYDGLKYYYFGYLLWLLEYYPMNGILLPGKPVNVMTYFTFLGYNSGIGVRYTTNGTTPISTSKKLDWGITINPGTQLRIKLFSTTGLYDKEVKGNFSIGKIFTAQQKPVNIKSGGLHFTFYEEANTNLPVSEGIADSNLYVTAFSDTAKFVCNYDGYIQIKQTGYYTFLLNSDQNAKLSIDKKLLMESEANLQSFVLPLEQGFHHIHLSYTHEAGKPFLELTYVPSAIPGDGGIYKIPIKIPGKFLYGE